MKNKKIVFKLKHLYKDDPVDRLRGINIVNALQKKDWNVELYNNQKNIDIIVYLGDDLYDKIIYQHIDAKCIVQDLQDDPFKSVASSYMRGTTNNSFFKKIINRFIKNNFKYAVYQLVLKYVWKLSYKEYIKSVDYVITSSYGLQKSVQQYNENIMTIPDAVEYKNIQKSDYASQKIKICWVGTTNNIAYLLLINEVLSKLQVQYNVEIIIITSKEIYNDSTLLKIVSEFLFEYKFIAWNISNVNENIKACDIAIAPLPISAAKSTNKILSYMSLGVPTVCSGSEDYKLLSKEKENSIVYVDDNSFQNWYDALVNLVESEEMRKTIGKNGYELSQKYTLDEIVKKYEELFKKL